MRLNKQANSASGSWDKKENIKKNWRTKAMVGVESHNMSGDLRSDDRLKYNNMMIKSICILASTFILRKQFRDQDDYIFDSIDIIKNRNYFRFNKLVS